MKVLILTEAGGEFGFGHLTRCIGLYQGFKEKKIDVKIAINANSTVDFLMKNIKHRKIDWLKAPSKILEDLKRVDVTIIDSYLADLDFYKKVSKITSIPVYIDDFRRLDYPRGLIINPSIYGDKIRYTRKKNTSCLLGKNYIILREEFQKIPKKKINRYIKNVLFTLGGVEYQKLTKIIKSYLKSTSGFNVYTVEPCTRLAASKILNLMLETDLCISGGGQTIYELAHCGVPTIGICVAENQRMNLIEGEAVGFLTYIGSYKQKNLLSLLKRSISKLSSYEIRAEMSKIGRENIDGNGVKRIVDFICKKIKN